MTDMPQQKVPWLLTKGGVLVMLFLVLGPFGLPFLYKSPEFTKNGKVVWTLVVLLYTAALVAIIVVMIMYILRLFSQLQMQ
jgi:hypothetical protein